jgi:hypothetical protein
VERPIFGKPCCINLLLATGACLSVFSFRRISVHGIARGTCCGHLQHFRCGESIAFDAASSSTSREIILYFWGPLFVYVVPSHTMFVVGTLLAFLHLFQCC